MIAASNSIGRDDLLMVDTKDIERILRKLNEIVIPGIAGLDKRLAVVETKIEENTKSRIKEDTERLDLLKIHDRILRGDNGKDTGLVSKVKDLQVWRDSRIWLERAVLAAVLIDIVLRLIELI